MSELELTKEQQEAINFVKVVILQPVLNLLQTDPHHWSSRPCSTCRAITAIVGEPFGCEIKK